MFHDFIAATIFVPDYIVQRFHAVYTTGGHQRYIQFLQLKQFVTLLVAGGHDQKPIHRFLAHQCQAVIIHQIGQNDPVLLLSGLIQHAAHQLRIIRVGHSIHLAVGKDESDSHAPLFGKRLCDCTGAVTALVDNPLYPFLRSRLDIWTIIDHSGYRCF